MKYPKITIITPSYNQGQYIEATIQSILGQNYPYLEYLIFDGGSNDNTVPILKKYDEQITYWESKKDKGQTHAINKGFEKASGEIITWINSDDVLMPNVLFEIAKVFNETIAEVGVIHGASIPFNDKKEYEPDYGFIPCTKERCLAGMAFPQPASFIRKKYWDSLHPIAENLHFGMDYELFSKLSLVCEFKHIDLVISKNRLHVNSKTLSNQMGFYFDWHQVFCQRLKDLNLKELSKLLEDKLPNKLNEDVFTQPNTISNIKINSKELVFYHYCYLYKYAYWSADFKRAKKIKKFIGNQYSKERIQSEKEIGSINKRLLFPVIFIRLYRKLKRILRFYN